jgi:ELWxxDGT repeat protein
MKNLYLTFSICVCSVYSFAQIPQFTKDINTQYQSSNPINFHTHDSSTYFVATSNTTQGAELWKTDGSAAGTFLLKDIYDGAQSSGASNFLSADSLLYFTARDAAHGIELWKTDGTATNTILVKDIRTGTTNAGIANMTYFASKESVVFTANDGTNGNELWISNGTVAGTKMLKDIQTGALSTSIASVVVMGNYCFFLADDGLSGRELWRTDGTEAGTILLKDIKAGGTTSNASQFTAYNGKLYFRADNTTNGQELWCSDGTSAGTTLIKDINTGSASSNPSNLMVFDNQLFFSATELATGTELWTTDGTAAGTTIYMDRNRGTGSSSYSSLTVCNGTLFFAASSSGGGKEVMRLHPLDTIQELSVNRFGGSNPTNLVSVGSKLFFLANVDNGIELYVSDGTTVGTKLTRDLYPIQTDGFIRRMTVVDSTLYFVAHEYPNYHNFELYTATSTQTRPRRVKDILLGDPSSNPTNLTPLNGELLFTVNDEIHGMELWKSASATNADLLKDIYQGTLDAGISTMAGYKHGVLFNATDDLGNELWKSGGTSASTSLVDDIRLGSTSSSPNAMFTDGDRAFFMATSTSTRLHYSDGKESGTGYINVGPSNKSFIEHIRVGNKLFLTYREFSSNILYKYVSGSSGSKVVTINPSRLGDDIRNLTNFNGTLYFTADENANYGNELWKSNGTSSGTELVKNIRSSRDDSNPGNLLALDSVLLFSANNGSVGSELWRSKGTDVTTELVMDINSGSPNSEISQMTNFDNKAYFSAIDGVNGRELWVSDGTTAGTHIFMNAATGDKNSNPTQLMATDDKLYFILEDSATGNELWVTDGTNGGTHLLKDIRTGTDGSDIENLTRVRDMIYFTANDGINGAELWKTDGTTSGTSMVTEVATGSVGSNPQLLTLSNDTLFYTAYHPDYGVELWYVFTNCMVGGFESASACVNDSIQFNDLSNALGNTISGYHWEFGNGDTAVSKNPKYAYSMPGTYRVTLTVETEEGCSVVTQKDNFIDTFQIINFSVNNDSACLKNNSFKFTNLTEGDITNSWKFGDGGVSAIKSPTYSYVNAGTYAVELTVENQTGCSSSETTTVYVLAAPVITAITGVSESKGGNIDSFSVLNNSGSTYDWTVTGGSVIEGQGTSKVKVEWRETTTLGFVRVTETSQLDCRGDQFSKQVAMKGLSVSNTKIHSGIEVYPNPFIDKLNYQMVNFDATTRLSILDITGKELVLNKNIEQKGVLDLGSLMSGVYILRFTNGGASQDIRIIKR